MKTAEYGSRAGSLLCVANFPDGTGYAWDFIEELHSGISDRMAAFGVRTWVGFPSDPNHPAPRRVGAARGVSLDLRLRHPAEWMRVARFVLRNRIRVLYLCDRPYWSPKYAWLRLLGVRHIVVHDHTSGARTPPAGARALLKRLRHRIPGTVADQVVAVSGYVARRKAEVDLVPGERISRVWNSVDACVPNPEAARKLRVEFGIAPDRPVLISACRASKEKGIDHLFRAFDRLRCDWRGLDPPPVLLYLGDGPNLPELRRLRESLETCDDILIGGYRRDASLLFEGATLCVVPSVWQEAFGLAALEPMARGVPVVASRVGGIPEVVVDGETGVLVPPGDEAALEEALRSLLANAEERQRLGLNGRRRAGAHFTRERQIDALTDILAKGFEPARQRRAVPTQAGR